MFRASPSPLVLSCLLLGCSGTGGEGTADSGSREAEGVGGGQVAGSGGAAAGPQSGAAGEGQTGNGGSGSTMARTADCEQLVSDPTVNWRDGALTTDQEIVECLWATLGRPVGYGENAMGGYDPGGSSRLVVITKSGADSPEQQLLDAIGSDGHAWIVFDKGDFASPSEVAMYRVHCGDAGVQAALGTDEGGCVDYESWCSNEGISSDACRAAFFNGPLDDGDLPIRNPRIGSNKTIDGRQSQAFIGFSGFAIGADSDGAATETGESVIVTHLEFIGAGHTEDHGLDPDMLRVTGESHDVWIHKNTFDLTGDSAFDVKVGGYDVTMSFNRVLNVLRASLHGSKDSREINAQITTTMHHNAFVTTDDEYEALGNTGRRVPLLRRGTSHIWNNVFVNYRKDVMSLRVGGSLAFEDNAFVVSSALQEKSSVEASLDELQSNMIRDVDGGHLRAEGNLLWFSTSSCVLDTSTERSLDQTHGSVAELSESYGEDSQDAITEQRQSAGQELIDYVVATAGKQGAIPFNSPQAPTSVAVVSCQ